MQQLTCVVVKLFRQDVSTGVARVQACAADQAGCYCTHPQLSGNNGAGTLSKAVKQTCQVFAATCVDTDK